MIYYRSGRKVGHDHRMESRSAESPARPGRPVGSVPRRPGTRDIRSRQRGEGPRKEDPGRENRATEQYPGARLWRLAGRPDRILMLTGRRGNCMICLKGHRHVRNHGRSSAALSKGGCVFGGTDRRPVECKVPSIPLGSEHLADNRLFLSEVTHDGR